MSGDGVAISARARVRTLDDVHTRAIVLQEIEIHSGESAEGVAQVTYHRHRLEKYLRQHPRGSDVDIPPACVEALCKRAQQPEIAMRGDADGAGVGTWMGVGC